MRVELINTGTELMLGRVLNTHQQWLCRALTDRGYLVARQVAVPDTGPDIRDAVRECLGRADIVITTGGLGPTSDDITRDLVADLLGKPLHEDSSVLQHIQGFFRARQRPMPERTRLQALVPEGAIVLHNAFGTAPGLAIHAAPNLFRSAGAASWLFMLPGPPRELRPMFLDSVVPLLMTNCKAPSFACRTLRATGVGESVVEERVAGPLAEFVRGGLELGYCSRPGQVDVRVSARGVTCQETVAAAEGVVRSVLGSSIYSVEEEEIETVVVRELTNRKKTIALAESCTGGCIAHRLTNVSGASAVLLAGLVTYSNQSKRDLLGIPENVISQHGAVSETVARLMAEGVRGRTGADYAVSVTGIAGPSGGTPSKPVGTVFIGIAGPSGTRVEKNIYPTDRETFKQVTAQQALDLVRQAVLCAE